jgi:hypothetical protein
MSRKQIWRMAVDLAVTVILLLLMGYSRIGETAHEVLGVCMFTLFILHHILNLVFFLMDYLAIMGLFVFVSHYISTGLRYFIQGGANKNAGKNVRK